MLNLFLPRYSYSSSGSSIPPLVFIFLPWYSYSSPGIPIPPPLVFLFLPWYSYSSPGIPTPPLVFLFLPWYSYSSPLFSNSSNNCLTLNLMKTCKTYCCQIGIEFVSRLILERDCRRNFKRPSIYRTIRPIVVSL